MKQEILYNDVTGANCEERFSAIIEKVAGEVFESEGIQVNAEISVSFVDNEEIRRINKKFRKIDRETDVLSFPILDFSEKHDFDSNTFYELGDIIISYEKALSQAESYNHSIEREIAFLSVHSMLHLLGYDHMTEEEEKLMFAKQEDILSKLNITR